MAEDVNNPLNNPSAEPIGQTPTPRSEPPEIDEELESFLDDEVFGAPSTQDSLELSDTPHPESEPTTAPAPAAIPSEPETTDSQPAAPAAEPDTSRQTQDELQRTVLERLNTQLERMEETPTEASGAPAAMTPDEMQRHYLPRIEEYVKAGWLDEDFVALYPGQTALMVHLYEMGTEMQQGVQQSQQFTQGEQTRRAQDDAARKLDTAIDEVAARGEVFGALGDKEVRESFRNFLIDEVNPRLGQVTPEYLARQFYAYNQPLIYDLARQQGGQPEDPSPSLAADLAQQEGASARTAPTTSEQPDFIDLLEGNVASQWYG